MQTATAPKPTPSPDNESRPFWDALRQHRLVIQTCRDCTHTRYPPTTYCPRCHSPNAEWVESGGEGAIYSWIVVRHPIPFETYANEVPYVVALIDLDEGVRMVSNIVGTPANSLSGGMRVKAIFEDTPEGMTLPKFTPA